MASEKATTPTWFAGWVEHGGEEKKAPKAPLTDEEEQARLTKLSERRLRLAIWKMAKEGFEFPDKK